MVGEKVAPIIKWAGGKRQLIKDLVYHSPDDFKTYHEFFFGGGALYFELYNQDKISSAYLSDLNPKLMNVYSIVKKKPYDLIEELKTGKYSNNEGSFYNIRAEEPADLVQQSARFMYLNKTAFNGLYRENSKGKFNVPFGKYTNPKICDEDRILAVSEALAPAHLLCGDFAEVLKYAHKNDFAYFDPPYHPLDETSSFTAYTKEDFNSQDQIRLKKTSDKLKNKGVKVLLSNSFTDFITDLYGEYAIEKVYAKRIINCKAEHRGEIAEVLARGGYK